MIGRTISHYKITEKLGEGGMGVVYKADDTKLDRPVALKFLATHLVSDDDIRKRFEREAKAAAALNHPNICHVYGIDEVEGKTFIAMAFLEGEGLDKKIEAGPLKLKDALDIAIQTAQGLQAAHEKGIVHRDIKPANLMVTGSGSKQHVTIMDFGLAQLADRSKLTRMDETMGTVIYMSPEQTYGTEIDHRSDIWSLGVVIYEMVVGEQPFKGHYDKAVMYSITSEDPEPMTALRTGVPMELELLVNKCLAKDADRRYQSTADMVVDLETLSEKFKSGKSTIMPAASASAVMTGTHAGLKQGQAESPSTQEASEHPLAKYRVIENLEEQEDSVVYRAEDTHLGRSVAIRVLSESEARKAENRTETQRRMLTGLAAALAVCLGLVVFLWLRNPSSGESERLVRKFSIPVQNLSRNSPVISPDGKHIAYVAGEGERSLWVRDLNSETLRRLEDTEGARDPFWAPDSQWIAFRTGAHLTKVSVTGGEPINLSELPGRGRRYFRGSWSPNGERIVFSYGSRLYEVPSRGGTPNSLFELEASDNFFFSSPTFVSLRDGRLAILYTFANGPRDNRLGVLDLQDGTRHELRPGGSAVYSPTGHILFLEGSPSKLLAQPFSSETLAVTGEAFPILNQADTASLSLDGSLVYTDSDSSNRERQLVWRDRQGAQLDAVGPPQFQLFEPALSPDGTEVTYESTRNDNADLWVLNLTRGVPARLTSGAGRELHASWSPSGREIVYAKFGADGAGIYVERADGSGNARRLFTERAQSPSWSPDGRFIIFDKFFFDRSGNLDLDLLYLDVHGDGARGEPKLFVGSPDLESAASFSPDGKFVVYSSDESGRWEIYVRPFPEGVGKWQISANGGLQTRWSQDGKEIFYVEEDTLMAVPVSTEGGFTPGVAQPLFTNSALQWGYPHPTYAISPDAQKFLLVESTGGERTREIHVIENWYEEFRDREQN